MSKILVVLAVLFGSSGLIVATAMRNNAQEELAAASAEEKKVFEKTYPENPKQVDPSEFLRNHKVLDAASERTKSLEARKAETERTARLISILSFVWGFGLLGAAAWTAKKNATEQK